MTAIPSHLPTGSTIDLKSTLIYHTEDRDPCVLTTPIQPGTFRNHYRLGKGTLRPPLVWHPIEGFPCRCKIEMVETDGVYKGIAGSNRYEKRKGFSTFLNLHPRLELDGDFSGATFITISGTLEVWGVQELTEQLRQQISNTNFRKQRLEFMTAELKTARNHARHSRRMAMDLKTENNRIRRSGSWLVTYPLRWLLRPFVPHRPLPMPTPGTEASPLSKASKLPYDPTTLVSIAIPIYNGAYYLKETLSNVLKQSHHALEVVVVDDASTDTSAEIVRSFVKDDSRVRLYENRENLGMVANWNRAISLCRGKWVLLMGQDDLLDEEMVETALRSARKEIRLVLVSRHFLYAEDADPALRDSYELELPTLDRLGTASGVLPPDVFADVIPYLPTPCTNFIGEPLCGLIRKDVFESIGTYQPRLSQLADYEFWLRLTLQEPCVFLEERLVTFRVHGNAVTSLHMKDPVKGIHLESALLLLELLTGEPYQEVRVKFPELAQVWRGQLELDLMNLLTFSKRDDSVASIIRTACEEHPNLKMHLETTEADFTALEQVLLRFKAKVSHRSPGLILRKLQTKWAKR